MTFYEKALAWCLNNNKTSQQIEAMDPELIREAVAENKTVGFVRNVQRQLVDELIDNERDNRLDFMQNLVDNNTAIQNNYPDCTVTRGEGDDIIIKPLGGE